MISFDQESVINNNNTKKSSNDDDEDEWMSAEMVSDNMNHDFDSSVHLMSSVDGSRSDEENPSPELSTFKKTSGAYSWQGTFLSSLLLVLVICLGLFLGRTYVKSVLIWLEYQNKFLALLLFVVLFTIVSFPFMWGYILLNVVSGYLYGFLVGLLIVIFAVMVGTVVSHLVMRKFLGRLVASRLSFNGILKATLMVLGGPQTFKVVAITRLTPLPFGLQNALFAISPISTGMYLLASTLGLLPTQAINAYLGSTLRSMEDVLSDANTATTGYIVLAVQVVISICLMVYVVHKAKILLRQVMVESGNDICCHLADGSLTDINANGPTTVTIQ